MPADLARRRGVGSCVLWWSVLALGVLVIGWASLFIGSREVTPSVVWDSLFHYTGGFDQEAVRGYRLPRALLAIVVGAALGMAGSLIQRLMRNPLGDPQILGVNAGASLAVGVAIGFIGLTNVWAYVWFAFGGAVIAMAIVYALGAAGHGPSSPVRVTMAGIAISAVFLGAVRAIGFLRPKAFDALRVWEVGDVNNRGYGVVVVVTVFTVIGGVLALALSKSLDMMAMGDDLAVAMGVPVARIRFLTMVSITLLCGAATAGAGPIGFVGLMIPHAIRLAFGIGGWWLTAFSMVGGAALLLASDVVGRVIVRPDEVPVGIVTAFVGAPILILLTRRLAVGNR